MDTGNGTLGPFIMKVLEPLGIDVVPLYLESDPSFPHHLPDPLVAENLQDLVNAVHANKLDAGFAYDGDGDRLGVVDDKGDILWGDRLMILYARDLLARLPGAPVVFDVKCTRALEDEIRKAGGRPVMWKIRVIPSWGEIAQGESSPCRRAAIYLLMSITGMTMPYTLL